jgi:hypothetical protein
VRLQNRNQLCRYVALVGLGNDSHTDSSISFGRSIVSVARQIKAQSVSTFIPSAALHSQVRHSMVSRAFTLQKIFSGVFEACYEEKRYKSKPVGSPPSKDWAGIRSLSLLMGPSDNAQTLSALAQSSSKIAKGVVVARELVG